MYTAKFKYTVVHIYIVTHEFYGIITNTILKELERYGFK